jgi:hypothetical protein
LVDHTAAGAGASRGALTRRPVRTAVAAVIAVAAVGAGWTLASGHGSHARAGKAAALPRPPARPPAASGATTSTPAPVAPLRAGVEASWVTSENQRRGTTAWQINGSPPGGIAGFADRVFAQAGDTVRLYVSTGAATFHVDAYRMGYYGGMGARLVWGSPSAPGSIQPICTRTPGVNMVACDNWAPSLELAVTTDFVPGDYLLKLVGSGGQQSYVPLTVWDPSSRATYVIKNDVYTWQAWNPYGGFDLYAGVGRCPPRVYPLCSRARVVSFDRPYGYGQGAGDFLGNEYPLVRFVEQHGLDVTYATDLNLEIDPGFLLQHQALLSLGHDECWSLTERLAAVAAEGHGVNVAFFAASPMLRHVRLEPSVLGPDREVVDYRDPSADPLNRKGPAREVTGNTWSSPPASWSEVPFVGEDYAGYLVPGAAAAPFVVADAASWLYQGTGLHDGSTMPNALVTDFDQFNPALHPANLQILAHSPIPRAQAQTQRRFPYSDTTYYTDPVSGAGVFDSGINSWIPDLAPCPSATGRCPAALFGQLTANLLAVLGAGPAGHADPSSPNWKRFYP